MQQSILTKIKLFILRNRQNRIFRKFVQVLCCMVVFVTTYALILPAITMEQDAFCGKEAHEHTEECLQPVPVPVLVCTQESLGIHTHSGSCYNADGAVICGQADYVVHSHSGSCYDAAGQLVCLLPERSSHVHGESCYIPGETQPEILHVHSEACYIQEQGELICTEEEREGHSHGDQCYGPGDLLECTLTEHHVHDASCYSLPLTCSISTEPHVHSENCYGTGNLQCSTPEYHTHTDSCWDRTLSCNETDETHCHDDGCYTANLRCQIPENHAHSSSCYESILVCGKEAGQAHEHNDSCYGTEPQLQCRMPENHVHDTGCYNRILNCEVPEDPGHRHEDACYQWNSVLNCGLEEGQPEPTEPPEPVLACTEPEAPVHVHGNSCFELQEKTCQGGEDHQHTDSCYTCGLEAHAHTLICYSDPDADVESPEVWKATFAHVTLTGDWPTDVVAIAETQLGYTESTRNYDVWEDNSIHGYTRYGAWYGAPHGDWCGMFASFCLEYAGVEGMPHNYGVRPWIEELTKLGLYYTAKETKAQKGNLIFFDWDADGLSDHVGIVAEVQEAQEHSGDSVVTIEGNSSNMVKYQYYTPDDPVILGYGLLPGQERIPVTTVEPDDVPSSLQAILICGLSAHSHGETCYRANGTCICSLEEHIHTIDCVDSSIPVGYADGGTMMRMMKATRDGSSMNYHTDIADLFTGVAIYDSNNNLVYESTSPNGSGTVTIGENCRIIISFAEDNFNQFSTNSVLTYQIPANLSANLVGTGVIINREYEIIANYEIDNNQLKITPLNYGEGNFFAVHNDVTLSIEFYAEVIHSNDSSQTDIDFDGNFKVTINFNENPKIDALKYSGEYDPETRMITYQCKVTAYSGSIPITKLSDSWLPADSADIVPGSMQLTDKDDNVMNMNDWTLESHDDGFSLTPDNPITLQHQEFITLTYKVKVDDNIFENFDLNNHFHAEGEKDGNKYYDTDTSTTPVTVTNVEKSGAHTTEEVEGTNLDLLEWSVEIDNSTLDVITITDNLGAGQTFCTHKPISIIATRQDGMQITINIPWDDNSVQLDGDSFTIQLPTTTSADGENGYIKYQITYGSHFELNEEDAGLQVFENTVTTDVTIGGVPTFSTGSIGVVGIPPGIDKTAVSNHEWITFTITCRMPGGLYNQPNVLVYDSLAQWIPDSSLPDGGLNYCFQQNPDSMQITVTPDGGEPYELVPYTNQSSLDNTYFLVNNHQDFTIYFNTNRADPSTSVWKCSEDSTMTISYRVSRYTPLLDDWNGKPTGKTLQDFIDEFNFGITNRAKLDYAPGYSVEDYIYHVPPPKPAPPLRKTAELAEVDGAKLDGVYNYSVFLDTWDETSIFQYVNNVNIINSLVFKDTYDNRLEYVTGSFSVNAWDEWGNLYETFVFVSDNEPTIRNSGNTTIMTVDANTLKGSIHDWVKTQTLLQFMRSSGYNYEFVYQLKVKDSIKETTTEGVLLLDNTANIEWTDNTGPRTLTPAKNRVEYDTGVLQKGMQVVENSNLAEFTILVNHNALDLAVDGDSYVLYDTMSSNLMLLYDTLKIETVDKTSKATKEELSPTACKFEYDMDQNKMTLLLPDNEVIRLTYRCKVEGSRGEQVDISNKVELLGRSAIQDIVNSKFQIMDHEGTADGSGKEFVLQKRDGNNHQALAGVTFSLYGDVVPADYHEGTHTFIVDHTNVSDESKKHTHTMYYYGSFTTGTDGIAHISHTQLTKRFLYALIEEAPPTGYVALSEPYFFYMEEREDNALAEMPCLKDGQLVVIENYPIGYELPSTGGTGKELYTVGGTLLMLAAVILLYNQRKCRKEDIYSS